MRIAELVNHQTVERKLHFFKREVSLFECVLPLLACLTSCANKCGLWGIFSFAFFFFFAEGIKALNQCLEEYATPTLDDSAFYPLFGNRLRSPVWMWFNGLLIKNFKTQKSNDYGICIECMGDQLNHTSNQRRLPAGLKHLIKPRKRN